MRDPEPFDNALKGISVLCLENGFRTRPDHLYAPLRQRCRQIDRRLASEGGDHAERLLKIDDIHDIFACQRLKIQLVGARIVRGDRLRIIVDHDRCVRHLVDRPDGMHCRVIKLHALPDPDRSRAKDDDLLPFGDDGLILFFIGRIKIRHVTLKLAGTGIDHLVYGTYAISPAKLPDLLFTGAGQLGNIRVRKAHSFGFPQQIYIKDTAIRTDVRVPLRQESCCLARRCFHSTFFEVFFKFDDLADLIQEKHVDPGSLVNDMRIRAEPQKL